MNKKLLILCHNSPARDPRPGRAAKWFSEVYEVVVAPSEPCELPGIRCIEPAPTAPSRLSDKWRVALSSALRVHHFAVWRELNRRKWAALQGEEFDVVICEDIDLLPIAAEMKKKGTKVVFDAREFYSFQYSNDKIWMALYGRQNDFLLRKYRHIIDLFVTVSPSLGAAYKEEYGIDAEIVLSCPHYFDSKPRKTDPNNISLIFHGNANPARKVDEMVRLGHLLDDRFNLTFMLAYSEPEYVNSLKAVAAGNPRIRFVDPVPFEQIVATSSQYDIGLYMLPLTNRNNEVALPNKFFEYIQARNMLATSPAPEMARIVQENDLGVVAKDYTAESMAQELNRLSAEEIDAYKAKVDVGAQTFNSRVQGEHFVPLVQAL